MWLEARLNRTQGRRPIILEGDQGYGVARLIAALEHSDQPLIWMVLDLEDDDEIAQANKLAKAINRSLGYRLCPFGVNADITIHILQSYQEIIGPCTFAVSNAQYAPSLWPKMLALIQYNHQVVLNFNRIPDGFTHSGENGIFLRKRDLQLNLAEAHALAGGALSDQEVLSMLKQNDFAFEKYYTKLTARLNLPAPLKPGPTGWRYRDEEALSPRERIFQLLKEEKYIKSLSFTLEHLPEQFTEILEIAAPKLREAGLYNSFARFMDKLPKTFNHPRVLFWRLSSALRTHKLSSKLKIDIECCLAIHEAPELRALYADVFLLRENAGLAEIERAVKAKETPLTTYLYGRKTPIPQEKVKLLYRAVKCAETSGTSYDLARNSAALVACLTSVGAYQEAIRWGVWSLELYDQIGLGDFYRRLMAVNDWAYARIMVGDTLGLAALLGQMEGYLKFTAFKGIRRMLKKTISDYYVAIGESPKALRHALDVWQQSERFRLGHSGLPLTKIYLDLDRGDEAFQVAGKAFALTVDESLVHVLPAKLAYGMVLALRNPKEAVTHLEDILDYEYAGSQDRARAGLYLARAYFDLSEAHKAHKALDRIEVDLRELALPGLRLLSGPENLFQEIWNLVLGDTSPLKIEFLGKDQVYIQGKEVTLALEAQEALAILALNPLGLGEQEFAYSLFGTNEISRLEDLISSLQSLVPIESKPYRLALEFKADFLELRQFLIQKRWRKALALYHGPLLSGSLAPAVVQERDKLKQVLSKAVALSQDTEVRFAWAERVNTTEAWQGAADLFPSEDPRFLLCKKRIEALGLGFKNG